MEVVIVVGASSNPERYSYKAIEMLKEAGHKPIPVHPKEEQIQGLKVVHHLKDLKNQKIDTITLYVNSSLSNELQDDLLELAPKRVIFNPGTENPALADALKAREIEVMEACTLVLLRTHQF